MIKVKNLNKSFPGRNILKNINLELPNKGFVVIHGESGSGKTTLLNILAGNCKNYSGKVFVKSTCISCLSEEKIRDFRIKNIGYVYQNFNLLNLENVYQNIALPLDAVAYLSNKAKKRRVNDIMLMLDILHLKKKNINLLSGGEKQRVAIGRALINSPSVLLCDEPTGALDEINSKKIYELLKKLSQKYLIVVASHDSNIFEYSDELIEIEDGVIKEIKIKNVITNKERTPLFAEGFSSHQASLLTSFKIGHAFRKIKTKKFRSLFSHGVLSLGLTGVGLSLLLTNNIKGKIDASFSSLTNGNQIIMKLNEETPNTFGSVFSASKDKVDKLFNKYKYYIEGVGVNYMVNFEDFFKDQNEFFLTSTSYKQLIPSLSMRSINDYRWIDNDYNLLTYPYLPESLFDDEIVLGLDYQDMVNICYQLRIQRNYSSLGEYIRNKDLTITFEVKNNNWQYYDEQILLVRGITETKKTCIYHYKQDWNEYIFETMMRFPSYDGQESYYPWEMYKLYYFKTYGDVGEFIDKTLQDEDNFDFVLERTNSYYHPSLCKIGEVCKEKRALIFYVDKSAIDTGVISGIRQMDNRLNNYYYLNDYGYASYANNLLNGFAKNVFVSLSKSKIEDSIDSDTMIKNDNNINVSLPEGVSGGNYLNSLSGGLKFSTKPKTLLKGRFPRHNGEIAISKGLDKKLGNNTYGKELFIAGIINEYIDNNNEIEKEYSVAKTVVVGIYDEEKEYIYHNQNWTISFFRDQLGVSMFNLLPNGVVFELEDNVDSKKVSDELNSLFREYSFIDPSEEIANSVESTMSYASIILIAFSLLAVIISVILLGTNISLSIEESRGEMDILANIGIQDRDIKSLFVTQAVLQTLIAFLVSTVELLVADISLSKVLDSLMSTSSVYYFNPLPILIVFALSILLAVIVSRVVILFLLKKKKV